MPLGPGLDRIDRIPPRYRCDEHVEDATPARRLRAGGRLPPSSRRPTPALRRRCESASGTSARCRSTTRTTRSAGPSPPARRGSWRCSGATPCSPAGWRCPSTSASPSARCRPSPASRARTRIRSPRSSPAASCTRCGSGGRRPSRSAAAAPTTARRTPPRSSSPCSASCTAGACPTSRSSPPARGRPRAGVDARVRRPRRRRVRRVPARDRSRARQPGLEGLVRRRQRRRRAGSRSRRSRWPRCRPTSTPRTGRGPRSRPRSATRRPRRRVRARRGASRRDFNERFWLPDRGWFAMALDADKRPVDALASNMGHCLWTGIVDDDKAAAVAGAPARAADVDAASGVRTLATHDGRLQPDELPQRLGLAARHRDRASPASCATGSSRRRSESASACSTRRAFGRPAARAVLRVRPQ